MYCKCALVEIDGEQLNKYLGRVWDLGPVVVSKELGSNSLSIIGTKETFDHSLILLSEFKYAIMSDGLEEPLTIKMSLSGSKGEYDFGFVEFDDQVVCKYKNMRFAGNHIELIFEILAKGKELSIFNGNSGKYESTGDKKSLFWASLF